MENNILIAEFMGFKITAVEDRHGINIIEAPTGEEFDPNELKYNSSWDWLIPVVKNISEIVKAKLRQKDPKYKRSLDMHLNPFNYDIDEIYKHVVEFIKWYNYHEKQ